MTFTGCIQKIYFADIPIYNRYGFMLISCPRKLRKLRQSQQCKYRKLPTYSPSKGPKIVTQKLDFYT